MHDQRTQVAGPTPGSHAAYATARRVLCAHADEGGQGMHWLAQGETCGGAARANALDDFGEHSVAVLSGAVLRVARAGYGESQADFAARAGVGAAVVREAEDGTRPVWVLPYGEFVALADAVSVLNPWLRDWFETAAACDLLLARVLQGDQVLAADVLTEAGSRYLAKKLLRWAATGMLPTPAREGRPLLPAAQVALLRERAAALASSGSPDAWAGTEILSACCLGATGTGTGGQP